MKLIAAVVSLILILLTPLVAAAQTPRVIAGLQVIAERQYAAETQATIDTTTGGVFLVSARVFVFDTEDNANPVWEQLVAADSIEQDLASSGAKALERTELEDVGDRAIALGITVELQENQTALYRTVVTQQGNVIVSVTAIAGSEDAAGVADDIAAAMIERKMGSGAETYDGNGGSTGGVWELFLPKDDPTLDGLTAYLDSETLPAQD